jgi:hypothetical protein
LAEQPLGGWWAVRRARNASRAHDPDSG